jgi:hypothetical protein
MEACPHGDHGRPLKRLRASSILLSRLAFVMAGTALAAHVLIDSDLRGEDIPNWAMLIFFATVALALVLLVLLPTEIVAAHFHARWLGLVPAPVVTAGVPWLLYGTTPDKTRFLENALSMSLFMGLIGTLWALSSFFRKAA